MKILIRGGGTGGHIFPAIAVADELKSLVPDMEIRFVGALGKMEMEKIPKAGYPIVGLPIRGIQRRLTLKNLRVPLDLISSFWKVRKLLKEFSPDVVLGSGGYASAPSLKMAQWMNIPTAIMEQNNHPGMTNKLLAGRAKKIFVAYEGMEKHFAPEKLIVTGNPVRKDIRSISDSKEEAKRFFDWGHYKKTLLVFGGSLGARTLNLAMKEATDLLAQREDLLVIWQTGKTGAGFLESETAKLPNVRAMQFIDKMEFAYALADLVVCRAGALTISELALVGKPAVLVPSPNVAEDHQTANAAYLESKQAAEMVRDEEAAGSLITKVLKLLGDEQKLKVLSENIAREGKPDSARRIAEELLKMIKKKEDNEI